MMARIFYLAALASGLVNAQSLTGSETSQVDQSVSIKVPTLVGPEIPNPQYSKVGTSVTILDANYLYDQSIYYGASILDSNGDTTTFVVLPTILVDNPSLSPVYITTTMTVGPTTLLEYYTYSNIVLHRTCSFSGTTEAVCTSLVSKSASSTQTPVESTKTLRPARFQTYDVVVQVTSEVSTPLQTSTTGATASASKTAVVTTSKSTAGQAQITAVPKWLLGAAPAMLALL